MSFYTYLWLREDGTPYYVGKGTGRRAWRKGSPSLDRVLVQDFLSEADAFIAEQVLIACYGRKNLGTGCLINLTDGGDGRIGVVVSEETRRLLSESHKGNPCSEETRRKMSSTQKQVQAARSAEWCQNIGLAKQGIKNPSFGRPMPEKTRQAIAKANTGRKISAETLRKMMEARGLKGWTHARTSAV